MFRFLLYMLRFSPLRTAFIEGTSNSLLTSVVGIDSSFELISAGFLNVPMDDGFD